MTLIPTITQIFNGVIASMNAVFGITIPTIGKNFLRDLASVWAGKLKVAYLYLAFVQKNAWFDRADPVELGGTLDRFGFTFLQRYRYPATQGQYVVDVLGTAGAIIPANTTYLSDPTSLNPGFLFILDAAYVLIGVGDQITLRCTTAGSKANLAVGNTLTCTRPIVNVIGTVTVASIAVSAIDAETVEQYRAAIQEHVLLAPQGGASADYISWVSPRPGVRKVYPYTPSAAPWQVNVYVEAILSDSGGVAPDYNYGIPTPTILADATAVILNDPFSGAPRKPIGVILGPANVGALAVTVYQVVITFTGTGTMTVAQKALIVAALQQAVTNIRPFIAGADSLVNQNDTLSIGLPAAGGRIAPPENYVIIVIAMAAAPGAVFTGCSMTVNGVGVPSFTFIDGIIPYLQAANVLFT